MWIGGGDEEVGVKGEVMRGARMGCEYEGVNEGRVMRVGDEGRNEE